MKPGQFKQLVEKVYEDWDMPIPPIEQNHVGGNVKQTVVTLFDQEKIVVKITNQSGETKLTIRSNSNFYHPEHEWSIQELIKLADALDAGREILGKIQERGG
jgi:hypothetical protein